MSKELFGQGRRRAWTLSNLSLLVWSSCTIWLLFVTCRRHQKFWGCWDPEPWNRGRILYSKTSPPHVNLVSKYLGLLGSPLWMCGTNDPWKQPIHVLPC